MSAIKTVSWEPRLPERIATSNSASEDDAEVRAPAKADRYGRTPSNSDTLARHATERHEPTEAPVERKRLSAADVREIAKVSCAPDLDVADLLPQVRVESGKRVAAGLDGVDKPVVRLRDWDQYVRVAKGDPAPDTIYAISGKFYETDDLGRPLSTSGRLTVGGPSHRIPGTDKAIGHAGLPGDVGFHHGGDQFGFGGGKLNLSPGSGELNSGEYKGLEMYLKRQAAAGHDIDGRFSAYYAGRNTSERPHRYVIQFAVDGGVVQERAFFNPRPKG